MKFSRMGVSVAAVSVVFLSAAASRADGRSRPLVSYPGEISEKSGWKCVREEAGKTVYIPFEGNYESKGGRIESPKFALDKKADETAWYELTFLAKCAADGYWWVDVFDAKGDPMPDTNSRLYASREWKWYSVVVAAQPGTVAAKLAFVTAKGIQAKDVAFRRIAAQEAARWCHDFYVTLPQVSPEIPADAWAKLPKSAAALKAGKPVRILLLGDSIMNDTWCGNVAALVKEKFPNAEMLLSVRGSTGCWYYREEKNFDEYVARYNPDLVLVGGISNRKAGDTDRSAADSVVEVVRRCREKGCEVALLSPPPSWQFRRAQDDPYYDGETAGRGMLRRGWQFTAVAEADVAYWDVTTAPCRAMAGSRKPLGWFKRDGAHNDDRGKQLIARTLAAYFGVLKGDVAPAAPLRYGWRGFMLDECRHFFGKDVVKKYLDRMAALNLNVFHWHLTEDQAWRLDIPGMPELVKYGAARSSTPTPGKNEDSDGKPYGPFFYTADDVREIVDYAAARGIRVVPEIELPGHARALLAAHPEFACEGVGEKLVREPWTHFGICTDVLCAGNDEALKFYERVFDEVMKMFPGEFIHIGGDECPKDNWKKCPKCQARIKALGLKDERALQGWVTTRMANYIAAKGRRAVGWDEVLEGGDLPKSTVIQSWRGAKGGIAAAKLGHDVVMSPCEWTYFTFAEGLEGDPYKYRPWVRGKFLPAAKMRSFDPEAGVPEKLRPHILGAECCAWSEVLCDEKELEYKTLHRLPAFAEALEAKADPLKAKAAAGRLSVFDFGAKGDGWTDDTAAIQAGLDYLARRGGGKLYFPYTKNGYLVSSPAKEFAANGRIVRAQLVIPPGRHNIQLEGEMPCKLLYNYQVRQDDGNPNFVPTRFGENGNVNVAIHSTWDAPEEHDPKRRPWAIIAAPEGNSCRGHFSVPLFSIKNLEFKAHLNTDKMYPTTSAANLQNVSHLVIEDSQFCLDEAVGDFDSKKELLENPCHTVGLMGSGDQSDDQIFRNVAVQGFKYGFVFSEHTTAEHLYIHNCEYGVCSADATHPAILNRVLAQHCTRIFCALPNGTFGHRAGWINLIVNENDYETGEGTLPTISRMRYGVWDPDNRMRGSITYLQGYPGNGQCVYPVLGGTNLTLRALGERK